MRIGIGTSIVGGGFIGGEKEYLDEVAGTPTAAYSVRKVVSTYTDPVVEVRRTVSAVTVEADVSFDGDTITLDSAVTITSGSSSATTLGEFVAASGYTDEDSLGSPQDAFVATWYDQAGSNDATQTTASEQPKIYDASTGLVTENGQVALDFDGTNDSLINSTINITQPITRFVVGRQTDSGSNGVFVDSNVSDRYILYYVEPTNQFRITYDNTGTNVLNITANTNSNLFYDLGNSTSSEFAINGGSAVTGDAGSNGLNQLAIGDIRSTVLQNVYYLDGTIQEIIIYASDKSADRTSIEGNINGFFSIYS